MEPWLKKELHWITCDLKRKSVALICSHLVLLQNTQWTFIP